MLKRICHLFFFLLFAGISIGQEREEISSILSEDQQDRLILELTQDLWLDAPAEVELRTPSLGFNAYFVYDFALKTIGKSTIGIAFGYGISSHNVHHNSAFVTVMDSVSGAASIQMSPLEDYEKNKLSTNYLEIPFELRFRGNWGRTFKLYLGGKVGYLINDHIKIKDDLGKRKLFDNPYIEDIRYGLTARMGYGMIHLTAFYSLTPLLEEDRGPQLLPVSLGIAIIPF